MSRTVGGGAKLQLDTAAASRDLLERDALHKLQHTPMAQPSTRSLNPTVPARPAPSQDQRVQAQGDGHGHQQPGVAPDRHLNQGLLVAERIGGVAAVQRERGEGQGRVSVGQAWRASGRAQHVQAWAAPVRWARPRASTCRAAVTHETMRCSRSVRSHGTAIMHETPQVAVACSCGQTTEAAAAHLLR